MISGTYERFDRPRTGRGGYDLRVISLGAGVQSSAMYLMACAGEFKHMPDVAIFADTQAEPPWVYEQLDYLKRVGAIPIRIATAGNLRESIEKGANSSGGRFAAVPFWVVGSDGREALGRRHCTREYKIDVVKREIRSVLGLTRGQRAVGRYKVEEWVGISLDEAHRAKPSRYQWITTRWPLLLDRPMKRAELKAWAVAHGHPIPGKSACVFCPYRGATEYARMRESHPAIFAEAVKVDDLIRSTGTMRGMRGQQFILRTLKPLRELEPLAELEATDDDQLDLFGNECEGMCGV